MEFKLFGLKLGSDKKPLSSSENKKIRRSFVLPQNDDDAVSIEAVGGFFGQYVDFDHTTRNDADLIYKYREMSMHPECEAAVDDIVSDAIVSEENSAPVKIILDAVEYSDDIKRRIIKEFNNVLSLLNFQTKGYEIFRRWYIDGKLVYHIIVDDKTPERGIAEVRYVDPVNIQKVKQYKRELNAQGHRIITGAEEFYVYSKDGFRTGMNMNTGSSASSALRISPDAVVYVTSGLFDSRNKRTVGYLHKAIKPLNQLRMMEDAVVIYRLSRAPERRIFYIDVGNLPKQKAEQYVRDLMNKYRNKLIYDASTGEIRDDRRHMSMLEDYWLPRREGGKGTEITTLQGAQNLSELEDVKYFLKKLYKSLNVPLSRMDGEQKSFTIGKSTEITRDEIKFAKFVNRLRNKFSELFYNLLKTQLILKKIINEREWNRIKDKIFFDFLKDSYFAELKENEVALERANVLGQLQAYVGVYYSQYWIKKNILGMNDTEIEIMQMQIDQEKEMEKQKQQIEAEAEAQKVQQQTDTETPSAQSEMQPQEQQDASQPPSDETQQQPSLEPTQQEQPRL
jgi:hypothetical protein